MYNRPILLWAVVVCNLLLTAYLLFKDSSSASDRVVYFDAVKLVSNYEGIKASRSMLEEHAKLSNLRIDTLKAELALANKNFSTFKGSTKDKLFLENIVRFKQDQLSNYQRTVDEVNRTNEKKAMDGVLGRVNQLVSEYAKSHNYEIVLTGTQMGNIAYGDERVDITEDLLQFLNDRYAQGK